MCSGLHYNLLYREEEREMMALCEAEGVGVIPWSPLARGRLARATGIGSTVACAAHSKIVCFFDRATMSSPDMLIVCSV